MTDDFMDQFVQEMIKGLKVMRSKRKGYGNSLEMTGLLSAVFRVQEKLNRLVNITEHGLRAEIVDPKELREVFTDMGNLCFAGNTLLAKVEGK